MELKPGDKITVHGDEYAIAVENNELVLNPIPPQPEWVGKVREYAQHVVENWPQNKTTAVKAILNMIPAAPSSEEVTAAEQGAKRMVDVVQCPKCDNFINWPDYQPETDDTAARIERFLNNGGEVVFAHAGPRSCNTYVANTNGFTFDAALEIAEAHQAAAEQAGKEGG